MKNVSGYSICGDYSEADPPASCQELNRAADGDADHRDPRFAPLVFDFGIAVGVRSRECGVEGRVGKALTRRRAETDS